MREQLFPVSASAVDQSIVVTLVDTSELAVTGLVFDAAGVTCYYWRPGDASLTQIVLITLASIDAAHADGGFLELDATNAPGRYRLDLPDAAVASGENVCYLFIGFTATVVTEVDLLLDPRPQLPTGKVVADGANSTQTFKTDLTETSVDAYKEAYLVFRTGVLQYEVKKISGFNPTTDFITLSSAFSATPSADDEFTIINA